jgi:hypothetical protein
VAYAAAEQQGRGSVYVQRFPPTGTTYQLPARPGDDPHHPLWSPDGKELFYIPNPGRFEVVGVSTRPTFAFGHPAALPRVFSTSSYAEPRTFDVTPDGKFIATVSPGAQAGRPWQVEVVVDWLSELKARVPTK